MPGLRGMVAGADGLYAQPLAWPNKTPPRGSPAFLRRATNVTLAPAGSEMKPGICRLPSMKWDAARQARADDAAASVVGFNRLGDGGSP